MTRFLAAKLIFREERSEKLSSFYLAFGRIDQVIDTACHGADSCQGSTKEAG